MADIDVKRFVDINIETAISRSVIGTRDTVVLFTSEGTSGVENDVDSSNYLTTYGTGFTITKPYLDMLFTNNGLKCHVVEGTSYSALTTTIIANLEKRYLLVACACADADIESCYAALKAIAVARASVYGVDEKIILARSKVNTDESDVKNFAVKYSNTVGAEMTIAAYLTQINVYKSNTVKDYAFTQEVVAAEDVTDSAFGTLMTNNYNVDVNFGFFSQTPNAESLIRNLGGNCKNGDEITNEFVRIILHQTLTERLTTLLTEHLHDSSGVARIYTTIAQELENYKTCGYLTTDKVWEDADLTVTKNDVQYTIIEKGTSLISGYHIKVLPLQSLTSEERAQHKAPAIYVIIADQYSIRQITINGEVI